ncbi:MAG: hypothetical protein K9J12_01715 [Melioribacteraceae bacterium]|nr:hypothetical protein [Melioribacteraceae bacterium]MCF8413532.1 hypothetical protein [Melioribacteraceae bacterium]
MHEEIEKKFLIKYLPENFDLAKKFCIRQGYVAIEDGKFEVRIREKSGKFYQTVKSMNNLNRIEIEFEIRNEDFEKLWEITEGRRIYKTRSELFDSKVKIEIDIYEGELNGLQIAEVEFNSILDSENFVPPVYFGKEVTNDKRYKNYLLAVQGKPKDQI